MPVIMGALGGRDFGRQGGVFLFCLVLSFVLFVLFMLFVCLFALFC